MTNIAIYMLESAPAKISIVRGVHTMSWEQWYELRVAGSPGTTTGKPGIKEGIAIGNNGRLCALSFGKAMRFETEKLALDYLTTQTTPGKYRFEIVRCKIATLAKSSSAAANL